jgi:quercetin dioxygenase-like cupin family protein
VHARALSYAMRSRPGRNITEDSGREGYFLLRLAMRKAAVVRLADQPWERLFDGVTRRVIDGERMTFTYYRIEKGDNFPLHVHDQEQITYVLNGSLEFQVGTERFHMKPADIILIPPGLRHGVEANQGPVELLSFVSPARAEGRGYRVLEGPERET